jgi:hypothetical protein
MASVIYDPLARPWLQYLIGIKCFASLHYEVPDPSDPAASEISSPTYARSPLTWDFAKDTTRTAWNVQDLTWLNLDAVTLVGVGAWTDPTKGEFLLFAQLDDPYPVPARGSYTLAANGLFVHV